MHNYAKHVQRRCVITNAHKSSAEKPERKKFIGKPKSRWRIIKMDPKETGWESMPPECIQFRTGPNGAYYVNTTTHFHVSSKAGNLELVGDY
jgi:hypothetical protein